MRVSWPKKAVVQLRAVDPSPQAIGPETQGTLAKQIWAQSDHTSFSLSLLSVKYDIRVIQHAPELALRERTPVRLTHCKNT